MQEYFMNHDSRVLTIDTSRLRNQKYFESIHEEFDKYCRFIGGTPHFSDIDYGFLNYRERFLECEIPGPSDYKASAKLVISHNTSDRERDKAMVEARVVSPMCNIVHEGHAQRVVNGKFECAFIRETDDNGKEIRSRVFCRAPGDEKWRIDIVSDRSRLRETRVSSREGNTHHTTWISKFSMER